MKGGKPGPAPSRGHAQILKTFIPILIYKVPNSSGFKISISLARRAQDFEFSAIFAWFLKHLQKNLNVKS
jgi:hypothetical protein